MLLFSHQFFLCVASALLKKNKKGRKREAGKTEACQGLPLFILPFGLILQRPHIPPLALIKILAHIILTVGP